MGMFSTLMGKIFAHATAPSQPAAATASAPSSAPVGAPDADTAAPAAADTAPTAGAAPAASTAAAPAAAAPPSVDVTAILDGLAAKNSEHLDWRKSIVDMLKLLDMDSSLGARKELANDLSFSGDENDSATMNVWLHREVIKKLAENGGKVPAELLH